MGEHFVDRIKQKEKVDFIHHLLNDVLALDRMLEIGLIEDGVVRIGAEQEFCLVNSDWFKCSPAPLSIIDVSN